MIKELIVKNRSYRSFTSKEISQGELGEMLDCGRLGGAARNLQGIKYAFVTDKPTCDSIFPHTAWAGSIEWNPTAEESPRAYIVMCGDSEPSLPQHLLYFDMGIAAQNILLKATEMGYGGCILGAFNKIKVKEILGIEDRYSVEILIALGAPNEETQLVEAIDGNTTYYRDENNVHYVPKRSLEELVIKRK